LYYNLYKRHSAAACVFAGGKSGLRRAWRSVTQTGSDPRESATENIPPLYAVRVKRRGKSSPLKWRHFRQGKPLQEQGQIERRYKSCPLDASG